MTGLDFAQEMLDDAERRQQDLRRQQPRWQRRNSIKWVQGDAMDLPFDDCSFDAACMGYGLRNVTSIPKALQVAAAMAYSWRAPSRLSLRLTCLTPMQELHRVLRPGGKVAILDFNNSTNPIVDGVQMVALENVVVPAATSFGLAEEYRYLRPSIKRFPTGKEQEELARQAGFQKAVHFEVAFGLMGTLVATKAGE